jgi:hypothetical protein
MILGCCRNDSYELPEHGTAGRIVASCDPRDWISAPARLPVTSAGGCVAKDYLVAKALGADPQHALECVRRDERSNESLQRRVHQPLGKVGERCCGRRVRVDQPLVLAAPGQRPSAQLQALRLIARGRARAAHVRALHADALLHDHDLVSPAALEDGPCRQPRRRRKRAIELNQPVRVVRDMMVGGGGVVSSRDESVKVNAMNTRV